jgi:hypothetical protein
MSLFRLFLLACLIAITGYTSQIIAAHGMDFMPIFFGDIAEMTWRGQFNVDFTCFLALSAIWVSWRHQFSIAGLALGVVAFFGGMLFLSIYLLIHTGRSGGDVKKVLLGEARARA